MTALAVDLVAALDPVEILRRAELEPDPWQARALRSPASEFLFCCARQVGKSTVAAALALHAALYPMRPSGALVLVVAPSLRQSGEQHRRIRELHERQGDAGVPVVDESTTKLVLANGSRLLCLPGSEATVRGFSAADLVVLDEAGWVEDALLAAVRPMLATSGGRLVALSTPNGKRGWFYKAWSGGDPSWHRERVTAAECPRIMPSWLERERAALPAWRYRAEYLAEFVDPLDAAFATGDLERALDPTVEPLFGDAP